QGDEPLAGQFEGDDHDGALRAGAAFAPPGDVRHPRIRKDGPVELDGLFSVAVEPEVGGDLLRAGHARLLGCALKRGVHGVVGADRADSTCLASRSIPSRVLVLWLLQTIAACVAWPH